MSNIPRMTDITLAEKLERMLMNWAKPERCGVMLPGTNMTCDTAAVAIRAALSPSPSQVAPTNPAQVTDAIPAETLRQLDVLFGRTTQGSWRTYQNGVHPVEVGGMGSGEDYAICTHGPKSFANADWIATMHDEWPGVRAALSQPHPADERVVEALTRISRMKSDRFETPEDLFFEARSIALAALSATEGQKNG